MPEPPHGPDGGDRTVRIAAISGGVVLAVAAGLAVVVATSSGGSDDEASAPPSPTAASSPAASAAAPPTTTPVTPTPTTAAPSATASGPVQRWSGTLTLEGPRALRDLDTVPPSATTRDDLYDVRGDWLKPIIQTGSGAQVAVLDPGTRSDARACQEAASASGGAQTETLHAGDVVCVATAQGRVAKLVIRTATQTSTRPRVVATTTIWEVPR